MPIMHGSACQDRVSWPEVLQSIMQITRWPCQLIPTKPTLFNAVSSACRRAVCILLSHPASAKVQSGGKAGPDQYHEGLIKAHEPKAWQASGRRLRQISI